MLKLSILGVFQTYRIVWLHSANSVNRSQNSTWFIPQTKEQYKSNLKGESILKYVFFHLAFSAFDPYIVFWCYLPSTKETKNRAIFQLWTVYHIICNSTAVSLFKYQVLVPQNMHKPCCKQFHLEKRFSCFKLFESCLFIISWIKG